MFSNSLHKSAIMRWTIGLLVITLTLSWSSVCSQSTDSESLTSSLDTLRKIQGETTAAKATKNPPASAAASAAAAPPKQSYTSLLTGLFDTITTTSTSSDCPGKCVHVFASLLCQTVLDNVNCSEPSMRCCADDRPARPSTPKTTTAATASTPSPTTTSAPATTTKPTVAATTASTTPSTVATTSASTTPSTPAPTTATTSA